jgi:hypothetical protein
MNTRVPEMILRPNVPLHVAPIFPPLKEACNGRFPGVKQEITGLQVVKCSPFQDRDSQKPK